MTSQGNERTEGNDLTSYERWHHRYEYKLPEDYEHTPIPPTPPPPPPPPPGYRITPGHMAPPPDPPKGYVVETPRSASSSSRPGQRQTDPDAITPLPPLPRDDPDTETKQREDEERAAYRQQDIGTPSLPESQSSGGDGPNAAPPPAQTNEAIQPKSTESRNPQQYQSGEQMTLPIRGRPAEGMVVQDRESNEEDKPCCC
ncbi:hypothetical protein BS50DRAFT_665587 [Corynespora cassiicola Philippines]|uniref:Uncharacterized protein n=1 Tax=Corynespora cassiicola Philippines TaxID=1448308 RepID=A0A2T2NRI8_CORCC|nr:hypothetical protein BS50DRAFT_665587 [Corynespora cassiicola Philippines]